jgi:hypothetical protein
MSLLQGNEHGTENQTSHQLVGLLLAFTHNPRERLTLAGTQHTKCHILQRRNGIFKQLFPLHPNHLLPARHDTCKEQHAEAMHIHSARHSFIHSVWHHAYHTSSPLTDAYQQHGIPTAYSARHHTHLWSHSTDAATLAHVDNGLSNKMEGTNGEGFYRRPQPDFFPEEEFAAPGRECEADACNCWAWSSAISPSSSAGKLKPSYSVFFQ